MIADMIRRKLTYLEIQDAILSQKHVWLSKGTLSEWVRGIHSPTGSVNSFRSNPCPELAYVIGVVLGDGNLNVHGYNAEILLSVTDYDFAREFSRCLAKILHRTKLYKVRRSEKRNRWIVQGSSILLYHFLKRPWENLKPWVEYNSTCTFAFLRALFDSEGSISGRQLAIANTNLELLIYVADLLLLNKIKTGRPYLTNRSGSILKDPKTGKTYKRKNNCYQMVVRPKSLAEFARLVGFIIQRKQALLEASVA